MCFECVFNLSLATTAALIIVMPIILYVFAFYLISGEESFFRFLLVFIAAHIAFVLFALVFWLVIYLAAALICLFIGCC